MQAEQCHTPDVVVECTHTLAFNGHLLFKFINNVFKIRNFNNGAFHNSNTFLSTHNVSILMLYNCIRNSCVFEIYAIFGC